MNTPAQAQDVLNSMPFRCIGPPRGGRVVAVAGDPTNQAVFYFGAVAGGIYKTEDAGTTWVNISDGYLKTSAVGALAVSDSDPNVIYAGMGESTIRIDVAQAGQFTCEQLATRTIADLGATFAVRDHNRHHRPLHAVEEHRR